MALDTDSSQSVANPPPPKPPIVKGAVDVLKLLREEYSIPGGTVRRRILDDLPKKDGKPVENGIRPLLMALAEYLDTLPTDNRKLAARLRGTDGYDLQDILIDIARNPPDLPPSLMPGDDDPVTLGQCKTKLRNAMVINGTTLFDAVIDAIQATEAEKLKRGGSHGGGQNPPEAEQKPDAPKGPAEPPEEEQIKSLKRRGGSGEGIGHDGKPINDRRIKKIARREDRKNLADREGLEYIQGQADQLWGKPPDSESIQEWAGDGGPNNREIARIANRGLDGNRGYDASQPGPKETVAYIKLAKEMKALFEKHVPLQNAASRDRGEEES